MKRIKAIFNAIRTLGRNPHTDIAEAWSRMRLDLIPVTVQTSSSEDDRRLIEQCIFGVQDEAESWLKKLGEQTAKEDAK